MTSMRSSTHLATGPIEVSTILKLSPSYPDTPTLPCLEILCPEGLNPLIPQNEAGTLIDPRLSEQIPRGEH